MNVVLGDILPLALTVAISPIPIIAVILMLLSNRPTLLGPSFLLGWVAGSAIGVVIFTLLGSTLARSSGTGSAPLVGLVQLVLAVLLLGLAVKQWKARPSQGDEPEMPSWMASITTMSPGAAIGMGVLLSSVNPKNLFMLIAAGSDIGQAALGVGSTVTVIVIFVLLASTTVASPVILYLVVPGKATEVLDRVRVWLVGNNATVMAVLFLFIGVNLLGKAIASF